MIEQEMMIPSKIPKLEKKERKKKEPFVPLQKYFNSDKYNYEIGIDEAGRGPLFGRLYVAGVVLPKDNSMDTSEIRDSKKISKRKLPILYDNIIKNALAYHICFIESVEIDRINIRQAVIKAMHTCAREIINKLSQKHCETSSTGKKEEEEKEEFFLMVDGNDFPCYYHTNNAKVAHETFLEGDNRFANIAAASILAKVSRDNYVKNLCEKFPKLTERYKIDKNMGYGTKDHLEGIYKYGITQYHRRTYGICKKSELSVI